MDIRKTLLVLFLCVPLLMQAQTPPSVPIYSYSVPTGGYAANGNLTAYTDSVTGTWSAQYDSLNRLTGACVTPCTSNSLVLGWDYDSFGNRKDQTVSGAYSVPVASAWAHYDLLPNGSPDPNPRNRMTSNQNSPAEASIGYDGAGNMTVDGINQMMYDAENRICALKKLDTGQITEYLYDADGNRVAKGHPAGSDSTLSCPTGVGDFVPDATYIVGQNGEQVSELDGSGNWKHSNVYAEGNLLATYDQEGSQQLLHFNITDPLGTKRVQASSSGASEQTCVSMPFGDAPLCTGATEHFFTGKERDTESGLDYFKARYYGSSFGRFGTPDPSGLFFADPSDPQSLNLYAYARNNPLQNIDPTGLDCVYLNDAGTGVDRDANGNVTGIDHHSNSGECAENGGYWAPGNVNEKDSSAVQTSSDSDMIAIKSTTQGQNAVSIANCMGCSTKNADGTLMGAMTQTFGTQTPIDVALLGTLLSPQLKGYDPNRHYIGPYHPPAPPKLTDDPGCYGAPDAASDIHNIRRHNYQASLQGSTDGQFGQSIWQNTTQGNRPFGNAAADTGFNAAFLGLDDAVAVANCLQGR